MIGATPILENLQMAKKTIVLMGKSWETMETSGKIHLKWRCCSPNIVVLYGSVVFVLLMWQTQYQTIPVTNPVGAISNQMEV